MSDIDKSKEQKPEVKPVEKPNFDTIYKDNKDDFSKWIKESDAWKEIVEPYKDKQVTQGINTWQEKHLQSKIEEKVNEARIEWEKTKSSNPVDQMRAEMDIKIKQLEAKRERAEIKANASEMFQKLNMKFNKLSVEDFLRSNQDDTNDLINRFYEELKERDKTVSDETAKKFVQQNNYNPPSGNNESIPYGGDFKLWQKAIKEGKAPASGPEFMKVQEAMNKYRFGNKS